MSYVIERTDQGGGFVCPPGQPASYTYDLRHAWIFGSREAAEKQLCPGNEIVRRVDDLLQRPTY